MKNRLNFIKKYKKYFLVGAAALLVLLYLIFARGNNNVEVYVVENANLAQSVVLSGKISTSDKADLGFADSGRLAKILVKNNQEVAEGQVLAQLEIGDLLADLKIRELNLKNSSLSLE